MRWKLALKKISSQIYRTFATVPNENKLKKYLITKIMTTGPMTVAQYMEVAAGGSRGYYAQRGDIFGNSGDFVTSPEVSQLFGELIGLWFASLFLDLGHECSWQMVEFGPGYGKLMYDILRTFAKLKLIDRMSVHLVETSEQLASQQFRLLCMRDNDDKLTVDRKNLITGSQSLFGPKVYWHEDLRDVPEEFSFFVANEFFDALPVHVFQRTNAGWKEVLVDVDEKQQQLCFVLAPKETLTQRAYLSEEAVNQQKMSRYEASPYSGFLVQSVAERITASGGAALIVDYGHCGEKGDTLRGFSHHQVVDPLSQPGEIDITADVNFRYLRDLVHSKVCTFGPISQRAFLTNLGAEIRYTQLLSSAKSEADKQYLKSSYEYLISEDKMGARFKVFAMLPSVLSEFFNIKPLAGF